MSIHVPQEPKNFEFTQKEYVKFLKEYNGLIININGEKNFELPEELFNKKTFKRTKMMSNLQLNNILRPGNSVENSTNIAEKSAAFKRMNMMRGASIRTGRSVKEYKIQY